MSSVSLFSLTDRVSFSLSLLLLSASASSAFFTFQVLLLLENGVAQTTVVVAQLLLTHTQTPSASPLVSTVSETNHTVSLVHTSIRPSFHLYRLVCPRPHRQTLSMFAQLSVNTYTHTQTHRRGEREDTVGVIHFSLSLILLYETERKRDDIEKYRIGPFLPFLSLSQPIVPTAPDDATRVLHIKLGNKTINVCCCTAAAAAGLYISLLSRFRSLSELQ